MQRTVRYFWVIGCVFIVLSAHSAVAQSKKDTAETPFTLLLGSGQNPEKLSSLANLPQRKSLRTVSGRRLMAGVRASEYLDDRGGRITLSGLSNESDTNADQIIYQIPARSERAKNLVATMKSRYGQPDEIIDGDQIWHIRNPDMRRGQAKIINMRIRQTAGTLTIIADRTPITRRGELLVKPPRKLSVRSQTSTRNTQKATAQSAQKQIQEQYSID